MARIASGPTGWRGGRDPTTSLPVARLTHAQTFSIGPRDAYFRTDSTTYACSSAEPVNGLLRSISRLFTSAAPGVGCYVLAAMRDGKRFTLMVIGLAAEHA